MAENFWDKLKKTKKPIMVLAPMSGVTDQACRLMFAKYGKPDVFFTEFISASALFSPKARKYCLSVLKFSKKEKPIVAQIFGSNPEEIEKAAREISDLGFDGIDINMGCPDSNVEKQGAGSALIKNPDLTRDVIRATRKGAGKIPISVKTRIGYNKNEIENWLPVILKENVSALIVHFRTKKEGYIPPAHWELAEQVVKLRDKYAPQTLIIGNGDVKTLSQAKQLAKKYGLDGVMVGRATLGNPWFFAPQRNPARGGISITERLHVIAEHAKALDSEKHFDSIKKHFHAYTKGFKGARKLRLQLMKTKNATEAIKLVKDFQKDHYYNQKVA